MVWSSWRKSPGNWLKCDSTNWNRRCWCNTQHLQCARVCSRLFWVPDLFVQAMLPAEAERATLHIHSLPLVENSSASAGRWTRRRQWTQQWSRRRLLLYEVTRDSSWDNRASLCRTRGWSHQRTSRLFRSMAFVVSEVMQPGPAIESVHWKRRSTSRPQSSSRIDC